MRRVLYVFGQLSDNNIEWMIANGRREQAAPGTILIRQGAPTDVLLIVLDGSLGVFVEEAGREKQIAARGTGEILGEMSFIDDHLPTATVKAVENTILFTLPKADLERKLEEDRDFAARFYRGIAMSLSYRLREAMGQVDDKVIASVDDIDDEDALDSNVLESAYLAGMRFERILKRMMG